MSKEIIKRAVDRFLSWQLPKDFAPDCHVSFDPRPDARGNPITWPVGTNLLSAEQATAMFEHCLSVDMTSRTEAALRLILPMAKGYASAHPVGNNAAFIAEAEAVLESLSTPAPDPVGMDEVVELVSALRKAQQLAGQYAQADDWNDWAEAAQCVADALLSAISRLAQGEKWISVQERLPPIGEIVLLVGGYGMLCANGWYTAMSGSVPRPIQCEVTRWMEVPK